MTTYTDPMPLPTRLDTLTALMNSEAAVAEDLMQRFFKEHTRGERDLAGRIYDEYSRQAGVLTDLVRAVLAHPDTKVGDPIRTSDGPMIVAAFNDQRTVVVLTEDGLPYDGVWHQGMVSDEDQVRVERYRDGTRTFHGYIDSVSRRLTQTG